jgi:hypothetical protein
MDSGRTGGDDAQEWKTFVEFGGFKILALAGLSRAAYQIVCYLMNCYVSGIHEVLTSNKELSVLLGMTAFDVQDSLEVLTEMQIVRRQHNNGERFVLAIALDPKKWTHLRLPEESKARQRGHIGDATNVLSLFPQAMSFPHGDEATPGLEIAKASTEETNAGAQAGGEDASPANPFESAEDSAGRVLGIAGALAFDGMKPQDEKGLLASYLALHPSNDPDREKFFLDTLFGSHSHEQVERMVIVFGAELRSLGFLVGAWTHYAQKLEQILAEEPTSDLDAFRRLSDAQDVEIRRAAREFARRCNEDAVTLASAERVLLTVLEEHDHPRRQLYWALKIRGRYPQLAKFFDEQMHIAQMPPSFIKRGRNPGDKT